MRGHGSRLGNKWFLAVSLALLSGLLPIFVFDKPASGAGTLPAGFTQTRFSGGLVDPTAMAFAPDGRLFVTEQRGTLQVVDRNGQLQGTPFLDISGKVSSVGERGLLGVAFDPDFASNNYVYVYYTLADGTTPVHNRVARFTASVDGSGNVVAAAGSETPILELPPLVATNHNGGAIHFGGDGKLYVAVGENARGAVAQSLDTLLGKMLRINKDGSIPGDNPFFGTTTGDNRAIWALGLRNPYSFDVQPGTGRIFINDVGQSAWEEIDEGQAGANYGWPVYEGPTNYGASASNGAPASNGSPVTSETHRSKKHHHKHRHKHGHRHSYTSPPSDTSPPLYTSPPPYTSPLSYTSPLFVYPHSVGCAITGGAFYNPETLQFPEEYKGDYFFADFCGGWIVKFDPETQQATSFKSASGELLPVDLKVSKEGELYFLARGTGSVEKISYATTPGMP